ncbi:MAG: nitroreductase family protein [Bacteroidales bacterium]|nr:nitroreductase family protein [Bacteroidales bacterium]
METLHDLLIRRHSIRRYTDRPVDPDEVKTILEAALLAPTSKSARPWEFVVVENRDDLERLAGCKANGTRPISGCALAIVVCADHDRSDMFVEDMSIASAYMQLQATALGLGACWIQVRNRFTADGESAEDIVRDTLGIPDNFVVECIVTVGHPDEERRPVDPSKLLWEKIHIDKW